MAYVSDFYSKMHVFIGFCLSMLFVDFSTVSSVARGSLCDDPAKSFLVIVLVRLGGYQKCHQLGGLNNKTLFLRVLEARRFSSW